MFFFFFILFQYIFNAIIILAFLNVLDIIYLTPGLLSQSQNLAITHHIELLSLGVLDKVVCLL